jgi:uncharacterized membrane protein YccC
LSADESSAPQTRAARWLAAHRAELHFAVRVTVAGVAAYALAELLALPQGYWAVFTAVLVTQASVGGSLNAAFERLIGTLGGAVYCAVVAVLLPHSGAMTVGLALAVSLAPLAVLAAIIPAFRVAPVTAVILLLGNAGAAEGPVLAGLLRTLEVGLGGIVGLAVSMSVLPKRADAIMCETAERLLGLLAQLLSDLCNGLLAQSDATAIGMEHLKIRALFDRLEVAQKEWNRERRTFLGGESDLAPLPRTLRRIYHDLVLVGRVATRPFSESDAARAAPYAATVMEAGGRFFKDSGAALGRRTTPPGSDEFDRALANLSAHLEGANSANTNEETGRRAVLSFAIEQMQRDIDDLAARMRELAKPPPK